MDLTNIVTASVLVALIVSLGPPLREWIERHWPGYSLVIHLGAVVVVAAFLFVRMVGAFLSVEPSPQAQAPASNCPTVHSPSEPASVPSTPLRSLDNERQLHVIETLRRDFPNGGTVMVTVYDQHLILAEILKAVFSAAGWTLDEPKASPGIYAMIYARGVRVWGQDNQRTEKVAAALRAAGITDAVAEGGVKEGSPSSLEWIEIEIGNVE